MFEREVSGRFSRLRFSVVVTALLPQCYSNTSRRGQPLLTRIPKFKIAPKRAAIGLILSLAIVTVGYVLLRTQLPVTAKLSDQQATSGTGPLHITFNQEVAAGFEAKIEPAVAGHWTQTKGLFGVASTTFTPASHFRAGQTYHLRLYSMQRPVTGLPLPDLTQAFRAAVAPTIKSITPAGDATLPIKTRFTVTFAGPVRHTLDLQPSLAPAVPLKLISAVADTTFTWEPATSLKQSQAYTFTLDDRFAANPAQQHLAQIAFTTVSHPTLISAGPTDHLSPGQTITIVFDQPMQPDTSYFHFGLDGSGSWTDDHTYRFTPAPTALAPASTYRYVIKSGLRSRAGGVLEADQNFQFTTNGPVTATLSPGGANTSVGNAIRVTFDQPVDHASAGSHFSLTPAIDGKSTWSGNTLVFTPTPKLAYQTTYTASIASGVTPVWGQPSARTFTTSFTTEYQTTKLSVPAYHQQYPMSCELSSLRMLLAFRGISVSDYDILMRIGYNPRVKDKSTNTWDDPNATYVGFVDQAIYGVGFGVHSGPIAAAARSYGRSASSQFGVSAQFIASNIYAGNPVEFWGHITPARPDSWNLPGGGTVATTTSEHARVAYGVVGSADNPIGFYVNDPYTGGSSYWTTAQVLATLNVALPASNQAVVVY